MPPTAERLADRLRTLGGISEEPDRLTRSFLSPALDEAQARVADWMREAGLAPRFDAVGNLVGRREGPPGAGTVVVGSHLDTVRDAGMYDGPLGVVAGIAAAETLRDTPLPHALEVVSFADEEGLRFGSTYLGSSFFTGTWEAGWMDLKDAEGTCLRGALHARGSDPHLFEDLTPRTDLVAYVEAHIEQGPVLEAEGLALGVVSTIAGQSRVAIELRGRAGHAGTTPMSRRRDALAGAAGFVLEAERRARATPGLVATVGRCTAEPGADNVIPGRARFGLDLRHPEDRVRREALAALRNWLEAEARHRGLELSWESREDEPAVPCDPGLQDALAAAVRAEQPVVPRLVSGAGHDAVALSRTCPVGMLFVRCRDGLSHNPDEHAESDDIAAAARALARFLEALGDA